MNINATLIAQIIAFVLLVVFTMKFIWPPVVQALDERAKKIADGLAAAEQGKRQLADAGKHADAEIQKARQQAADILARTDKSNQEMIDKAKVSAAEEARAILDKAKTNVDQEMTRAKEALRDQVAALAVAGAERILKREIDPKAHADLIAALQQEL